MKIVRVIARLNVGGPAKHVAWLTAGLQDREWESLLVAGSVPPNEEDMSYFAAALGVRPLLLKEMSREISLKDALSIWKLYRLFKREQPDVVHTHTAKAVRSAGLRAYLSLAHAGNTDWSPATFISCTRIMATSSRLLWTS